MLALDRPQRNLALEQRMAAVEASIEKAGTQLTQIATAAKVGKRPLLTSTNLDS